MLDTVYKKLIKTVTVEHCISVFRQGAAVLFPVLSN